MFLLTIMPILFMLLWIAALGFLIYIYVLMVKFLKLGIAYFASELDDHRKK